MSAPNAARPIFADAATARMIADEAGAILAARAAAAEIAVLSADPAYRKRIPHLQSEVLARSGLAAVSLPRELGGMGASISTLVEIVRIISAADGGVGQLVQIHFTMLRGLARRPAGDARDRLVADVLAGKRFGHAGAEVGGKHKFDTKTRAERDASGRWVVNGAKFYTTGSYLAEWISSGAVTDEGPISFLVHRDTPGLILEDNWTSFGQRHSVSGGIRFENLVLDPDFVTEPGSKLLPARPERTGLTFPQILHAAIDAGIARGALDAAVHYLRNKSNVWIDAEVERASQEPMIVRRVGDYAVAMRIAESLLRDAAELFDAFRATEPTDELEDELILAVASARAKADYAALLIASDMFSLLGASASYSKHNLDRFWADARVHTTHDPIRWRLHHLGNYYLNGVRPGEYSAAFNRGAPAKAG